MINLTFNNLSVAEIIRTKRHTFLELSTLSCDDHLGLFKACGVFQNLHQSMFVLPFKKEDAEIPFGCTAFEGLSEQCGGPNYLAPFTRVDDVATFTSSGLVPYSKGVVMTTHICICKYRQANFSQCFPLHTVLWLNPLGLVESSEVALPPELAKAAAAIFKMDPLPEYILVMDYSNVPCPTEGPHSPGVGKLNTWMCKLLSRRLVHRPSSVHHYPIYSSRHGCATYLLQYETRLVLPTYNINVHRPSRKETWCDPKNHLSSTPESFCSGVSRCVDSILVEYSGGYGITNPSVNAVPIRKFKADVGVFKATPAVVASFAFGNESDTGRLTFVEKYLMVYAIQVYSNFSRPYRFMFECQHFFDKHFQHYSTSTTTHSYADVQKAVMLVANKWFVTTTRYYVHPGDSRDSNNIHVVLRLQLYSEIEESHRRFQHDEMDE